MPQWSALLPPLLAAATLSASIVALPGRLFAPGRPALSSIAWLVGISAGFFLGVWLLDVRPNWPPREDQDRFLLLVFPALLAVELIAAAVNRAWLIWPLRWLVAAGTAPVLLHQTIYVSDVAGPDTRLWNPLQTFIIFISLTAALGLVWSALARLAQRAPGRAIPFALALSCAGTGLVVMLSGYASGGLLGLPLAAALAGATIGSLAVSGRPDVRGAIAPAVVGLFALLGGGLFFGELSLVHAVLLFFAPLLCCLVRLPLVRRLGPVAQAALQTALVGCVVAAVLHQAFEKFAATSTAEPGATAEMPPDEPW